MSMFYYQKVQVKRSETTKLLVRVPAWEIEVLKAVHGDSAIAHVGQTHFQRELPSPAVEYDRLALKYGIDRDGTKAPFVAVVYGVGERGVASLATEIEKAGAPVDDLIGPVEGSAALA